MAKELAFMENSALDPQLVSCPHCGEKNKIGVHSKKERRFRCHECQKTFSESKGTVFYGLHYPLWVVIAVLTLVAYGCPVIAIVKTFLIDERTVRSWLDKAGQHAKIVQDEVVCNGQLELGQVQADEICVKIQGGQKVWVATAMDVFSRLFIWGEVSTSRDSNLIVDLMSKVREAVSSISATILFAVDGFAAYPKAILKVFHTKLYTGKRGRPRHIPWPNIHIVQVVKSRSGKKLKDVTRRLAYGSLDWAYQIIGMSQGAMGMINTAYIERLNATFRSRMPSLVRRTRSLARTVTRLESEVFWSGTVYNFCAIHTSLDATPAQAAGLTDHLWSIQELLFFRIPPKSLHDVV